MRIYENYKNISSSFWLSHIPQHWEYKKMKYIFSEHSEKGHPHEPLLVASQNMGVVPKDVYGNRTVEAQKDLHLLKFVNVGDFVISLRSFQGGIEYAYYQGIISPAYTILTPKDSADSSYLKYLLKSVDFISLLKLCVTGIREGQNIDYAKLKNYKLPVPPRTEQDQIVKFLDWKVSEVNRLMAVKKKQVSAYKELRKAVIDQGILHGFSKSEKKDSGVYWLGEIPVAWEVLPLKRICRANASIADVVKTKDDSELVTFLPMENITETGEIDCSVKKKIAEVRTGFSSFAKGDVVVAKITPCFENGKGACLDDLDTDIGFGTTEFINLRPSDKVLSEYLYMITMTRPFRKLGEEVMTGSAGQKRIPSSYIKNFVLGIPDIEEQKSILLEIDKKITLIDNLIEIEQKRIDYLKELKSRIIADTVTGKIDVRNIEIPEFEEEETDSTVADSEDEEGTEE